jgi:hypothetical protein
VEGVADCDDKDCGAESDIGATNVEALCGYGKYLHSIFGDSGPSYHDLAHMYLAIRKEREEVAQTIAELTTQLAAARATTTRLNRRCQEVESALGDKLTRLGLFHAGLAMYVRQRDEAREQLAEALAREAATLSVLKEIVPIADLYVGGIGHTGSMSECPAIYCVAVRAAKKLLANPSPLAEALRALVKAAEGVRATIHPSVHTTEERALEEALAHPAMAAFMETLGA